MPVDATALRKFACGSRLEALPSMCTQPALCFLSLWLISTTRPLRQCSLQIGITLVGTSSLLGGEGSSTHEISPQKMLLGMGLIVASQVSTALHTSMHGYRSFVFHDLIQTGKPCFHGSCVQDRQCSVQLVQLMVLAPIEDAPQHPDDQIRIYVYDPVRLLHCFSDGTCAIMSIATDVWLEIMHAISHMFLSISHLSKPHSPSGLRNVTYYGV